MDALSPDSEVVLAYTLADPCDSKGQRIAAASPLALTLRRCFATL